MKIKITEDYQGLKAGRVIDNMCPTTADVLISKGVAVSMDGPKLSPAAKDKPKADKPLNKCNLKDLAVIVEKENVDIGDVTTKADIVVKIEGHRKTIAEAAEINEYLAGREDCDDTCRYAEGDDCTLGANFECPKDEAHTE